MKLLSDLFYKNNDRSGLWVKWILLGLNALFLIYFLILGYYNRYSIDDYCYLEKFQEYGFLSPLKYWYFQWQGRLGPQFLMNIVFIVKGLFDSLLPYTIFLLGLMLYGTYGIFRSIFTNVSKFFITNFAILIVSVCILANLDFSTFYWINVSTMYFGGVAFTLVGLRYVLSSNNYWSIYALIAFCFLFVSTSAEHYSFFVTMVLLSLSVLFRVFKLDRVKYKLKKIDLALAISIVGTILILTAPGNEARRKYFDSQDIIHTVIISVVSFYRFFVIKLPETLPVLLGVVFPFIYLGKKLNYKIPDNINVFKIIVLSTIVLLLLTWCSFLPTAYAIGEIGAYRAYTFLVAIWAFYFATLSLLLGVKLKSIDNQVLNAACSVSLIVFVLFMVDKIVRTDIPFAKNYAAQHDQRNELMLNYTKTTPDNIVQIDSLDLYTFSKYIKRSEMEDIYMIDELTKDTTTIENRCKCAALGLNYKLVVK